MQIQAKDLKDFRDMVHGIITSYKLIEGINEDAFVENFGEDFGDIDKYLNQIFGLLEELIGTIKNVDVLKAHKMQEFM